LLSASLIRPPPGKFPVYLKTFESDPNAFTEGKEERDLLIVKWKETIEGKIAAGLLKRDIEGEGFRKCFKNVCVFLSFSFPLRILLSRFINHEARKKTAR
jgi:hypothetical protein